MGHTLAASNMAGMRQNTEQVEQKKQPMKETMDRMSEFCPFERMSICSVERYTQLSVYNGVAGLEQFVWVFDAENYVPLVIVPHDRDLPNQC